MSKQEVTIHDIARELNISPSTVSRALNDHPRISKKTIEKVKKLAEKRGYIPNNLASNFRRNKTNTIGLIIPQISRHFFSQVIGSIQNEANDAGYNVIICQSNDSLDREEKNALTLFSNRVDGVIVSLSMRTTHLNHLHMLREKGIPVIFFDRVPAEEVTKVVSDDFDSAYQVTEHLIDQGCSRIAHLGGILTTNIYQDRFHGFEKAMKDHHLPIDSQLIHTCSLTREDGTDFAKKVFSLPEPPDSIICGNDTSAVGVISEAKRRGIQIPEEIAIIGRSNEPYTDVIDPPLTTVDQDAWKFGKKTFEMLLKHIDGEATEPSTLIIPSKLIIRESSLKKKIK